VVHGGHLRRGDLWSQRVSPAPSLVAQKLPVLARYVLVFFFFFFFFFCRIISYVVFLRFFQSLPMIFADVMGLFLEHISSNQLSF
jgi:Na+/H+ antiporter NhaC